LNIPIYASIQVSSALFWINRKSDKKDCVLVNGTSLLQLWLVVFPSLGHQSSLLGGDPEISSIAASAYSDPKETNKRNYTKIIDLNNSFDNKRELEPAFDLANALASNNAIRNETSVSSNVTNQTSFLV
jgi:hypothetical protein